MRPHRVSHPAVVGLAIAAIAAPAAAAAEQPYHPRGLDHMSELGRDPEPAATRDEGGVGAAIDDRPRRAQQQRLAAQVVKAPSPCPRPPRRGSTGPTRASAPVACSV